MEQAIRTINTQLQDFMNKIQGQFDALPDREYVDNAIGAIATELKYAADELQAEINERVLISDFQDANASLSAEIDKRALLTDLESRDAALLAEIQNRAFISDVQDADNDL